MNKKIFLFLLSGLAISGPSFGEAPKMVFEQNKNQWPGNVKFKADIPGGDLFLEKNTFTYLYEENIDWHHDHHNESGGPVTVQYHAFKVNFENSNPEASVFGNNQYAWHRNYYRGNDPAKWAENVPVFGQVYYKDLYEKIDMQVYNVEQNLKYDLIVHPGGDPKNIKLKYDGTDGMHLENGHLYIKTSLYLLIEQKPFAYQEINGVKKEIPCSYVLNGNVLGFSLGNYNASLPLVIDPTLIAATYTGSNTDNWGFTATYDAAGNIYIGGTASGNGYPTTSGAFQTTYAGGIAPGTTSWPFDISLTKFNPTGSAIMFSTYYGGSSNEQPHSLMVNGNNEMYLVGRTASGNFPVTAGVYQNTLRGGYDIIVGKFNSTGGLMASTFIGGTGDDCVNYDIDWNLYGTVKYNYADDGRSEIILDGSSNVYVAACTRSSNFPTTAGAIKTALGGQQDGVVFKMNSTLTSLLASTYLGGTSDDAAYGLKLDKGNNIYVTGGTASNNFPTTAGVLNPTYKGGIADGFIVQMNNTCTSLLRGTYLGTTVYDQSYLLEIDTAGSIYVFGQTKGAYPVTAGVYTNPNSGQFIHKLDGALGTTIFSTVVGTGGNMVNISPTAFLVDNCDNIYIAGWGRSSQLSASTPSPGTTTGLPITANAIQSTTDGADIYFAVFTANAQALWFATFYGQNGGEADHVDGGTCRFDKAATIYEAVCASCGGGQTFPTTPTAWSKSNNGAMPPPYGPALNCNEAVVKMNVNSIIPLISQPLTICPGAVATLSASGGGTYSWTTGSTSSAISITPTITTTYSVTVTNGGCSSTVYQTITVNNAIVATISPAVTICTGSSASLSATGGGTYTWSSGGNSSAITVSPTATTTYSVTVNNGGCQTVLSQTITVGSFLAPTSTSSSICAGATATLTASGGNTYTWSNGQTGSTLTANPASTTTYTVLVSSTSGCTGTTNGTITVLPLPTAVFTNSAPCLGVSVSFTDGSLPAQGDPIQNWNWTMTGGAPSASTTQNTISYYNTAGTYTTTLVITSQNGCIDTVSQKVIVYANPIALFGGGASSCAALCHTFNDSSQAVNGNIASWYWTFPGGSPSTSTSANPTICYNTPGAYGASLMVTTNYGCKDTMSLNPVINVYPVPTADFCISPSEASITDPTFTFCDLWSSGVTQWFWTFGDGDSDFVNTDPVHSYSASVMNNDFYSFNICLNVRTANGCWDSICKTVELIPEFTFYIPNTVTPNGDGINEFFFGKGRGIKEYDIWLFDRWGNMIWSCHYEGSNTGWDVPLMEGMPSACKWDAKVAAGGADMSGNSGKPAQEDVYVWKVKLVDIFKKDHTYIGHVNIVK